MPNVYDVVDDFEPLVSKYIQIERVEANGDTMVRCPLPGHKETKGSFSINVHTAVYHCFGCNSKGNALTLVKELEGLSSNVEANDFIMNFFGKTKEKKPKKPEKKVEKKEKEPTKYIDKSVIDGFVSNLNYDVVSKMKLLWGATDEAIKEYEIGWDGSRVIFPIHDEYGYVNVRRYMFDAPEGQPKVISYDKGYGEGRLWPLRNLLNEKDTVWLCEGEKDCFSAISRGLNAVTGTTGAGTFKDEWVPYFKNKHVNIVYDNDDMGKSGAMSVLEKIKAVAAGVRVIHLPVPNNKEDLSDFFNKYSKTVEDLYAVASGTEEKVFFKEAVADGIDMSSPVKITLADASKAEYFNKAIEMECLVVGTAELYMPPKKIEVCCPGGFEKCKFCIIKNQGTDDRLTVEFSPTQGKVLNLIDCSDPQQIGWIKRELNLSETCRVNIKKLETFNIQVVALTPKINFSGEHRPVYTKAYYIGQGLQNNSTYLFRGYTTAEPKHNFATQVLIEALPDQASIRDFRLAASDIEELEVFRAKPNPEDPTDYSSIENKMIDITKTLECNITKIWGREHVHLAVDIAYHTPQSFMFSGELRDKGWADILIVGDPRTGKNKIAEGMMKYYGMGVSVSGESVSFSGLVAGQDSDLGIVKWGIIPQNDGRLVIIDEMSGLDVSTISRLSSIRDVGNCVYIKIKESKTFGRTRLIFLSNPRGEGVLIKDFPYGINVIKSLIGNSEDIARFDFVLVLSDEEVNSSLINKIHDEVMENKYPSSSCKKLIQWAWSRRPDEVIIDRPAVLACLQCADILAKKYSPSIPLVIAADVRFKIAKVAAALAVRTFNTYDKDARTVVVEARHVYLAKKYIEMFYDKRACAYDKFSYTEKVNSSINFEPDLRELMNELKEVDMLEVFYNKIVSFENEVFSHNELSLLIGEHEQFKRTSKQVMSVLMRCNAIKRASNGSYRKTPCFIKWLESYMDSLQKEGFELGSFK